MSTLTTILEGSIPLPLPNSETIAAIKRTVEALHGGGPISAEVRVLDGAAIYSGCFDNVDGLALDAATVELKTCSANLYLTVNPVLPRPQMSRGRV